LNLAPTVRIRAGAATSFASFSMSATKRNE
jgi:hypothetical protein